MRRLGPWALGILGCGHHGPTKIIKLVQSSPCLPSFLHMLSLFWHFIADLVTWHDPYEDPTIWRGIMDPQWDSPGNIDIILIHIDSYCRSLYSNKKTTPTHITHPPPTHPHFLLFLFFRPVFNVDTLARTPGEGPDQKQLQQPGAELGSATGAASPGAAPGRWGRRSVDLGVGMVIYHGVFRGIAKGGCGWMWWYWYVEFYTSNLYKYIPLNHHM